MKRMTAKERAADQFNALNWYRITGELIPGKGGTIADPSTLGGLFAIPAPTTPHIDNSQPDLFQA